MKIPKLKSVALNSLSKKKKILLLSDDLRMSSGVGVMSREIVMGTLRDFDWVQVGGAIKHPDKGKIFDLSSDLAEQTGVEDSYCKIYPVDGYGNPDLLRDSKCLSSIIIYGMTYLIQCGTNLIMRVVI